MDFEPEEIFEKLKKNKLAIPAIGVGLAVGIFLLYKSNSSGASLLGAPSNDSTNPQPVDGGGSGGGGDTGGGGSGDSGAIGDLQNQIAEITSQQQGYATSFQDALNKLSDSLFGQLNQQAAQLQNAGQSYFSDGQQPNELDTYASGISSRLNDLYSMLSAPHIPDFASVSPALDTDKSIGQIQHIISQSNQVVNSNILNALNVVNSGARVVPSVFPKTVKQLNFLGRVLPSFPGVNDSRYFFGRRITQPSGISQGILDRWKQIVIPQRLTPVIQKTPSYYGFQNLNYGNFASVYNKVKANSISKPVIKKFGFKPFGF